MADDALNAHDQFNITVLLQNGSSALFKIAKNDTVSKLKMLIEQSNEIEVPEGKSTNILYLGHILNDSSILSDVQKSSDNDFTVNCFFKQQNPETQPEDAALNQNSDDLHGFDRLSRMNYSQHQILSIRQQFHRMMNSNELTHEQQIDVEEEWLPALFNGNEIASEFYPQNRRDDEMPLFEQQVHHVSSLHLLAGFCFGIIFGAGIFLVIPFFSHEKRMVTGIILGVLLRYTSKMMIMYS